MTGTTTAPGAAAGSEAPELTPDLTRAERIIGQRVHNPDGENVGRIEDLILDPSSGQVQEAIIGVGGFLGIGSKKVAIPFAELKIQEVAQAAPPAATTAPGSTTAPTAPAAGAPAPVGGPTAPATGAATEPVKRVQFVIDRTKDQLKEAPEFQD